MKSLYTENKPLTRGMVYEYSGRIVIVWNIYDASRTVFVIEGQMWRKAGEFVLGENESLHQWKGKYEFKHARAESTRGELVAVTSIKTYWKYDRNALPGFNIPVYRKVTEKAPTKYYLWAAPHVQIYLSAEEAAALDWIKY